MSSNSFKVDLHTHSIISYDGGIDENGYRKILESGVLDVIAITDHNEISFAKKLREKYGDKIIIGQEIDTKDGQLVGLFLKEKVPSGLTVRETCQQIHAQDGIVYIPHPFEAWRYSMQKVVLENIVQHVDIIEVFNARGIKRGKPKEAEAFATRYDLAKASSSDAHGYRGIGTAYCLIEQIPKNDTIVQLLHNAQCKKRFAPLLTYFAPKFNRIRKTYAF